MCTEHMKLLQKKYSASIFSITCTNRTSKIPNALMHHNDSLLIEENSSIKNRIAQLSK